MKIITWNCNMAFRKKANMILVYKPDILIVPECEHPDKINFDEHIARPKQTLWFGKNLHKGLGIFSYNDYTIRLLEPYNQELKMVIPIVAKKGRFSINLYAIWANNPDDSDGQYVEQVWKAVLHYNKFLSRKNTLLVGDFNSNTIWDQPRRKGNHSTVVKLLEKKRIYSMYHKHFEQLQGSELHPTLYLYRHRDKSYHIDYCFASKALSDRLKSVEIGEYDSWIKYSDHVPVIVTFSDEN